MTAMCRNPLLVALSLTALLSVPVRAQVGRISTINGSATLPAITFTSDPDTGTFRVGANEIGVTTGGTQRLAVDTARILSTLPWLAPDGTASAPAVAFSGDTNTGIYRIGADNLGVSTGGALRLDINTARVLSALPIVAVSVQWAPGATAKPACDSTSRGTIWYTPGGAGVADTFEKCRKDAADAYAWVTF